MSDGSTPDTDGARDPGEPSIEDQMVFIKWSGRPHMNDTMLSIKVNFLTTRLRSFLASIWQRTGDLPEIMIASGSRIDMAANRDTVLNNLPGTWSKECTVRLWGIAPLANSAQPPPESGEPNTGASPSTHHKALAPDPLAENDQQEDEKGWGAADHETGASAREPDPHERRSETTPHTANPQSGPLLVDTAAGTVDDTTSKEVSPEELACSAWEHGASETPTLQT